MYVHQSLNTSMSVTMRNSALTGNSAVYAGAGLRFSNEDVGGSGEFVAGAFFEFTKCLQIKSVYRRKFISRSDRRTLCVLRNVHLDKVASASFKRWRKLS